jgi:hypothetical protein
MDEITHQMNVGFTGTRLQLSNTCITNLKQVLEYLNVTTFKHGDCEGADTIAHNIAKQLGYSVEVHPPNVDSKRTFCDGDIIHDPKPYIDRNKDIVDECDILIATPHTNHETIRSGTFSTIRYARKKGKKIIIIYPDGTLHTENIETKDPIMFL